MRTELTVQLERFWLERARVAKAPPQGITLVFPQRSFVDTVREQAESGTEFNTGDGFMKAVLLGASFLVASLGVAQERQTPPATPAQGPSLSTQVQPSEVDKAKATLWQPKLEPQITYSGPIADLINGQNPVRRPPAGTNMLRAPYDDMSVDLITRRPRGIVLFAINF